MAERVDAFPRDPNLRYPWDDWLDGSIWKLTPGSDFHCTVQGLRSVASRQAMQRGLRAKLREDGSDLYLQATPR